MFFIVTARAESTPVEAGAPAEPEVSVPELTVAELVSRALENNPQPAMARANLEAARARAGALKALPNPVLQLVPGFSGSEEARDEEIVLSQPLDLFGQRKAQRKVLEAEARRVAAERTLLTRALIVEVKNAAANLFAAQEAESLGSVQVEVARKFRDAAARRAELGDVPPVQVQRADLELLRTENELTSARAERRVRLAILNQLIGQAPQTALRVALTPNPSPKNWERGALGVTSSLELKRLDGASTPLSRSAGEGTGVRATRPDIAGAEATLEARRAEVEAVARQRWPQVELQVRRDAVFGRGDVALRAVISAPIFDFGAIKHEKRAAQAAVKVQEAQIALLKSQAASQVEQALIRLEEQRARVKNYRDGIVPQTLDLLRKTQIGYDAGASTYLEVLEAQRTLRATQTEYVQALVGVRASEAQLESALGAALPENLSETIANPQGARTPAGVAAPGTIPSDTFEPNTITPSTGEQQGGEN